MLALRPSGPDKGEKGGVFSGVEIDRTRKGVQQSQRIQGKQRLLVLLQGDLSGIGRPLSWVAHRKKKNWWLQRM